MISLPLFATGYRHNTATARRYARRRARRMLLRHRAAAHAELLVAFSVFWRYAGRCVAGADDVAACFSPFRMAYISPPSSSIFRHTFGRPYRHALQGACECHRLRVRHT